jgi:putative spermidine/putrescine transport system substrate-binding protein
MEGFGRHVSRRRILRGAGGLSGLVVLGSAGVAAADSGDDLLVTVSGGTQEQFQRTVDFPGFEKATGGKVTGVSGLTMQNLAKLRAARGNPSIDVIAMDPPGAIPASRDGLLQKLDPDRIPNMKQLFPWAIPDTGDYVAVAGPYQLLAYNTQSMKAPPESWLDLWKPEYKGRVIIPDITTSHGVLFIAIMSKIVTGDFYDTSGATFKKLVSLKPNVLTYWTSHDQVSQLLNSAQAWLGPWISDRCLTQISVHAPIDLVVPAKEGAILKPTDVCIAKGTPHLKLAEAYVNFLLDATVQKVDAETIFNIPSNRNTKVAGAAAKYFDLASFNLLNVDWDKLADAQSAWTDQWNRDMVL